MNQMIVISLYQILKVVVHFLTINNSLKIQQQFLSDILSLKQLVHYYVNDTYAKKIDTFYEKIRHYKDDQDTNLLLIFDKTRYKIHKNSDRAFKATKQRVCRLYF